MLSHCGSVKLLAGQRSGLDRTSAVPVRDAPERSLEESRQSPPLDSR